jgi:hypothetical protein
MCLLAGSLGRGEGPELSDGRGKLCAMPKLSAFDQRRLAETLRRQHDIVARRQAIACGMTENAIRHRIRADGPWQVPLPGIYAVGRGRLSDKQRAVAAFLYAGRAIAITGSAAIAWHGLPGKDPQLVDVLVPLHLKRSDVGFVRLRRTSVTPGVAFQDGVVNYAPLDRAIADAVRQLSDMTEVRDLVASAVQRGKVDVWQLLREVDLGPKQGSARLRLALAEVSEGVRSVAENDLRMIIRQFRLPVPLYNPKLFVGSKFLAQPDAWWPDWGLAAEVESKAWHLLPADWQETLDRQARMSAEGILVLPFSPTRLRTAKQQVARDIRSALARSRGPLTHITTRPVQ